VTVFQDIRGALTTRANTTSGIPSAKSYEGERYVPTVGTEFIAYTLLPTQERPSSIGQAGLTLRQGLFQISLHYPSGSGTGTAESIADAVKSNFVPGTYLTQGDTTVRIRYAERSACRVDAEWVIVDVTIGWDLHTATNS
jgi:Bacteriophage related domain of unknown function